MTSMTKGTMVVAEATTTTNWMKWTEITIPGSSPVFLLLTSPDLSGRVADRTRTAATV